MPLKEQPLIYIHLLSINQWLFFLYTLFYYALTKNIIQHLLQEYEIEIAEDIQDALKDLLGGTIKEMYGGRNG